MTMRLSTISFAGTARTDVAVGISRLASMFVTTRAEVPLSFSITSSASEAGAGFALGSVGVAVGVADAGAVTVGVTTGCAAGAGFAVAADLVAVACGEYSLGE